MYVWTQKAERDFKTKYPRRACQRKAGTEATYDGRKLTSQFVVAYTERGWIDAIDDVMPEPEKTRSHRRCKNTEKEKVYEKRWKDLQFWMRQKNVDSIQQISHNLGLSCRDVLRDFVKAHGEQMAAKYGKLPYFVGGQGRELSSIWTRVMEAKA